MAQQLPPRADQNAERVQSRPYETDFAFFPEEETHATDVPGSGPDGPYEPRATNWPLALMLLGFAAVLLGLFATTAVALLPGLALMVIGGIWGALRSRAGESGAGQGTGPVRVGG